MEKEMTIHSSILAWKILWAEEPGGLQSMGSQRVRHKTVNVEQMKNISLKSYKGYMIPVSQEICFHCLNIVPNKGRLRAGGEGVTEEEMIGWHHRLNGHEFEQTLGDSEGQGSLV